MDKRILAILSVFAIFGVMGSVSAANISCSFSGIVPSNGSRISDQTPVLKIIPVCNSTSFNMTFNVSGQEEQTIVGVNGTVNQVTLANKLTYGATYYWTMNITSGVNSDTSGQYLFHLSRFGAAGETIDAVTSDIIDPIASLVLGLIKLFVALFVIAMIGSIFSGIQVSVKKRL